MQSHRAEHLAVGPDDDIRLADLLGVLVDHWRTLVVVPLVVALAALGATYLVTPVYTATTRILVPQQQGGTAAMISQQLGALAGLAGSMGVKNPADQYVAMIQSRTIANRLLDRFDLPARYEVTTRVDARRVLSKRTDVVAGKDGMIAIEVDDAEPEMAARLAAAYVEELGRMTRELTIGEAAQRREFFERQLDTTRTRLDAASGALRAGGIGEGVLKSEPRVAIEAIARLRAAITAAEVRMSGMRYYMSERNPEYQRELQELAGLRAQLARHEAAAGPQPADGGDYVARFRDFKYQETLFELLARQLELARLDEAREGSAIQVVDAAEPPERRSWPKRTATVLVAGCVGVALAVVAVFLREGLGGRFADPVSRERLAQLRARFAPRRRRARPAPRASRTDPA
jgi:uncharacterized protein involved in exopolysaccharide biosynthesis